MCCANSSTQASSSGLRVLIEIPAPRAVIHYLGIVGAEAHRGAAASISCVKRRRRYFVSAQTFRLIDRTGTRVCSLAVCFHE